MSFIEAHVTEHKISTEDYFGNEPFWRHLTAAEAAVFPYVAICQIQVWTTKERIAIGTGWLAGSATVITAAHVCAFGQSRGKYNVRLQFPSPFFQIWAVDLAAHKGFNGKPGMPFDIAALRLPAALNRTPLSKGATGGGVVEVPGFPEGPGQITTHTGPVLGANDAYLLHRADTFDGHSGAPILARQHGSTTVVGLHLGGAKLRLTTKDANVGLRLDGPAGQFVDSAIRAWG